MKRGTWLGVVLWLVLWWAACWNELPGQVMPRVASSVLLVADWSMSVDAIHHGFAETNVLLGPHPTVGQLNSYNVVVLLLNNLVVPQLPHTTRTAIWWALTGLEAGVVWHQRRIGLHLTTRL